MRPVQDKTADYSSYFQTHNVVFPSGPSEAPAAMEYTRQYVLADP